MRILRPFDFAQGAKREELSYTLVMDKNGWSGGAESKPLCSLVLL